MWKRFGPLLIVLSVGLNVAFVGAWVFQAARAYGSEEAEMQCDQACKGVSCPLYRNLGVTDAQWQELEPRVEQFQQNSQVLCQDIRNLSGELITLIAAPQPDTVAIAAKQEAILSHQRAMQEQVIAQLLAEKQMLTREQQAKLFQMIREKAGCGAHNSIVCPVSMSGIQSRVLMDSEVEP